MKILIALLLVFGLGGCLGNKMASPEVEFITVTRTKTVTEPAPPPVEVEVQPQSCIDAMKYADAMATASSKLYSRGRRQLDIFSDVRIALATDIDLNAIEMRQRRLNSIAVGDLSDLSEARYRFDVARKECEASKP